MKLHDYAKSLTNKALVKEWATLWESINIIECFSSRDLLLEYILAQELEYRGYELDGKGKVHKVREAKHEPINLERIS